jgi:ubiquinone/menaquinone biosynthesis C-methylase UbiE
LEDIDRALKVLRGSGSSNPFFLTISEGGRRDLQINPDGYEMEITHFPSKYDDIPLKSDYLDGVISLIHLSEVPDRNKYIEEITRIIKTDGGLMIVDYGRFDSYLLEEVFLRNVRIESDRKYKGEDIDDIIDLLDGHLEDIRIQRIREMFVITGMKV